MNVTPNVIAMLRPLAEKRLLELRTEEEFLVGMLSGLNGETPVAAKPRKRRMTVAARKEISARMKKYWASKRRP